MRALHGRRFYSINQKTRNLNQKIRKLRVPFLGHDHEHDDHFQQHQTRTLVQLVTRCVIETGVSVLHKASRLLVSETHISSSGKLEVSPFPQSVLKNVRSRSRSFSTAQGTTASFKSSQGSSSKLVVVLHKALTLLTN